MVCEIKKCIYIYKGDDTDFNYEKFVTVNLSPATSQIDLSTMTAKFILGSYTKTYSLAESTSFEIDLKAITTGGFAYGDIKGIIQIIDSQGRIKTVANSIPFCVTHDIILCQNQTLDIDVPAGSDITINLTVGGTVSYNDLTNKPSINGVPIEGPGNSETYGLASESDISYLQATKQDVISDLQTIRSGAQAGATALQPSQAQSTYIPLTQKAASNGVATLDNNKLLPANQLPTIDGGNSNA